MICVCVFIMATCISALIQGKTKSQKNSPKWIEVYSFVYVVLLFITTSSTCVFNMRVSTAQFQTYTYMYTYLQCTYVRSLQMQSTTSATLSLALPLSLSHSPGAYTYLYVYTDCVCNACNRFGNPKQCNRNTCDSHDVNEKGIFMKGNKQGLLNMYKVYIERFLARTFSCCYFFLFCVFFLYIKCVFHNWGR